MSEAITEPSVTRDDDESRYEIRVDGHLAGFTEFRADDEGHLVFPHTFIERAFSGRGLGTVLVDEAMADVARRGESVVPVCPFVARRLADHPVAGLVVERS